ncbi:hypothetical protein [Marinobacter sp. 2_MG-2023]|uniref:hypothetical protein n=1 Tax=Marinobacter sp. 2_MG-2023 TaxID=3062679 RepID=UPI0034C5E957
MIAAAGAGKTHRIISEAGDYANQGDKVLVVTYTESNQKELVSRFSLLNLDNDKL